MTKITINQNQTGILLQNGSIARVLSAGTYRTYGFRNETIVVYPAYRQSLVCNINVRTAEAAAIAVDVTAGITITDVKKLYLSGRTAYEIVSQSIARQLLAAAEAKKLAELLESNVTLDEARLQAEIAEYGLTAIVEIQPKISLPRNLQNAIDAQEVARQKAKAELEEARGRSAVIRHYANVAKVTKDNPDLLRLLLGQKAKSINVAFDAAGRNSK